jgi:cytochrome c oxidase subunit 2
LVLRGRGRRMRILNDISKRYQLGLQEESTPIAAGIYDLHEKLLYYIIIIIIFVSYILYIIISNNWMKSNKYITHNVTIEIIWTIFPSLILIIIAIPSFKLLYAQDEIYNPLLTFKAIGQQWFWSYEFTDLENHKGVAFDSYPINTLELEAGKYRLLEVDNPVYLPILTPIRLLTTSLDVIHSFAVPSFGIKIDAIPGRINHSYIFILREGTYYGQCSELCGHLHYNMPIVIKGVSPSSFLSWFYSLLD